jgi:hypothetical protein
MRLGGGRRKVINLSKRINMDVEAINQVKAAAHGALIGEIFLHRSGTQRLRWCGAATNLFHSFETTAKIKKRKEEEEEKRRHDPELLLTIALMKVYRFDSDLWPTFQSVGSGLFSLSAAHTVLWCRRKLEHPAE